MSQVHQLDAGLGGKFGVSAQHFDGERNFIDNALAGAVTTAEQFEVADVVVESVAVDVVDGFFGAECASDVLFHDVPMFENFKRGLAVSRRDAQRAASVCRLVSPSSMSCKAVSTVLR